MEKIEVRDGGHKWSLEFSNDKGKKHYVDIPPTEGKRIDYIDRNFHYHYNHKGVVGWGYLIVIENSDKEVIKIEKDELTRVYRILRE
jgi:hypothetical protein